ncbi:hypothetical protein GQR58_009569 [Nymphon striatum]|nr:hypothetical protein GQR58_009569 [Nymphon striatum]
MVQVGIAVGPRESTWVQAYPGGTIVSSWSKLVQQWVQENPLDPPGRLDPMLNQLGPPGHQPKWGQAYPGGTIGSKVVQLWVQENPSGPIESSGTKWVQQRVQAYLGGPIVSSWSKLVQQWVQENPGGSIKFTNPHDAVQPYVQPYDQLVNIVTKDVATSEIQDSLLNAEVYGRLQVNNFVAKRFVEKSEGLRAPIHKTKALTFASLYEKKKNAAQGKTAALKSDRQIFQRLITAFQAGRPVNLDRILTHELLKVPLSIAEENGSLRTGNKALLVGVLTKDVTCPSEIEIPKEETACLHGDRWVGREFDRIDVAFDQYKDTGTSIKDGTREKRKKNYRPIRRLVQSPFLTGELIKAAPAGKTMIGAGSGNDRRTDPEIEISMLRSDHEEADTRVVLHCVHASSQHIVVSARDTDITIILLAHFDSMHCEKLWLKAGTSKKPKYIPIHEIRNTLSFEEPVLDALLAFHAITGCDTMSYLMGHSKKTSWDVFLEHNKLLQKIGEDGTVSEDGIRMAEAFICRIYTVPYDNCDKGRVHLFSKCKPPEFLPPTTNAVRLHIQRANYQAFLWRQANIPVPVVPSPTSSGWKDSDGKIKPLLTTLPPVPKACREIIFCGCIKGCISNNCSCK